MTGMLWFDNDPMTDLATKIRKAAEYYQKKYGQTPNLCVVHPSMAGDPPAGIELRINKAVQPNHLFIGRESDAVKS